VHRCDFHLAGRLPNEDARAVTAVHEKLAASLADCFNASLGIPMEMRFDALDQLSAKDYVAQAPPLSYVMPFSSPMVLVEFDLGLVFPMIELLLGGDGSGKSADRDLSEIEEGIMLDVVSLVMRQAAAAWSISGLVLEPGPRIDRSLILQSLRPTEKVTALRFEGKFANASGAFNLVLSTPVLDLLVKQLKTSRQQEKARTITFPVLPLRERILACDFEVVAELGQLKVPVKDLVTLEPGSLLKLRVPVQTPAMLALGQRALFEAVPVRSGSMRGAQLGRRSHSNDWKRR